MKLWADLSPNKEYQCFYSLKIDPGYLKEIVLDKLMLGNEVGVRKWQQGRSSIICMCPCLIEDIKQEARLIFVFIQSLDLGKVHYMI